MVNALANDQISMGNVSLSRAWREMGRAVAPSNETRTWLVRSSIEEIEARIHQEIDISQGFIEDPNGLLFSEFKYIADSLDYLLQNDDANKLCSRVNASDISCSDSMEKLKVLERAVSIHDTIFRTKNLATIGVRSGLKVECVDSFWAEGHAIYTFYDQGALFSIILGGHGKRLLGCIVFGQSQYCTIVGPKYAEKSKTGARLFAYLIKRAALYPVEFEQVASSSNAPSFDEKRITLLIAGYGNFAHTMWNSYCGVERLVQEYPDTINHIDVAYSMGVQNFGSIHEVFPELSSIRYEKAKSNHGLDFKPYDKSSIISFPGSYLLTKSMIARIANLSDHNEENTFCEQFSQTKPFPVIWLGLRYADRTWVNQEEGCVSLIREISKCYPNAIYVFDGFTINSDQKIENPKWAPLVAALRGAVDRIRENVGDELRSKVFDIIGASHLDAFCLAKYVDFYIAPLGTAHHKVGWFSNADGIVIAPDSWSDQSPTTLPGIWQGQGIRVPELAVGPTVNTPFGLELRQPRALAENFTLDPAPLVLSCLTALSARGGEFKDGRLLGSESGVLEQ